MIIKKLAALLLAAATALSLSLPAAAENGKLFTLKITDNPSYTAVFACSGDSVSVSGVFAEDPPVRMGFLGGGETGLSFKAGAGGAFTASAEKPGTFEPEDKIFIELSSGNYLAYLIRYDGGWYFPDNGLSETNYARFSDIKPAPRGAAAYYLSAAADPAEIEDTLYRLREIAAGISAETDDVYEQAKLVCLWVADNVYYDHDAAAAGIDLNTVAIANVLTIKRTTCAGFANTTCALLEALGIRSVNIKGSCSNNIYPYDGLADAVENHEFSAFWYEKENRWVYVDSCWCSGNDYSGGEYSSAGSDLMYFDITGEAFSLNHRADKAEERFYFTALDEAEESSAEKTTVAPSSGPDSETTEEEQTNTTPALITLPPQSGSDSGSAPDTTLVLIAVLCLGAVAAAIILILNMKRNGKNR